LFFVDLRHDFISFRERKDKENKQHRPLPVVPRGGHPQRNENRASEQLFADEKQLLARIRFEEAFESFRLGLNSSCQKIYDENPHLREVFVRNAFFHERDEIEFVEKHLELNRELPSTYYAPADADSHRTTEHWGQRKLLITEIYFLTKYAYQGQSDVVYIGAAPAIHIQCLSQLFPSIQFHLYDEKPISVREKSQIQVFQKLPTAEDFRRFHPDRTLFICNFQTNNNPEDTMDQQHKWWKSLKPETSLLTFRLPQTSVKMKYLEGRLLAEPWASRKANHCRFIVTRGAKEKSLKYFHSKIRLTYYKNSDRDLFTAGLDHCFDCSAEIFILQQYVRKYEHTQNPVDVNRRTVELSKDISFRIHDKTRPLIIHPHRTLDISNGKYLYGTSF
jgi:hypothetical protein